MFVTPAFAQDAAAPAGGGLISFLPFILIFVIMYFLLIRPQQKRMREHREMLAALRRGDEVVTAGGVFAKITRVRETDEEVEAEIGRAGDHPVRVKLMKSTITALMSKPEPAGASKPSRRSDDRDDEDEADNRDDEARDDDSDRGKSSSSSSS